MFENHENSSSMYTKLLNPLPNFCIQGAFLKFVKSTWASIIQEVIMTGNIISIHSTDMC